MKILVAIPALLLHKTDKDIHHDGLHDTFPSIFKLCINISSHISWSSQWSNSIVLPINHPLHLVSISWFLPAWLIFPSCSGRGVGGWSGRHWNQLPTPPPSEVGWRSASVLPRWSAVTDPKAERFGVMDWHPQKQKHKGVARHSGGWFVIPATGSGKEAFLSCGHLDVESAVTDEAVFIARLHVFQTSRNAKKLSIQPQYLLIG